MATTTRFPSARPTPRLAAVALLAAGCGASGLALAAQPQSQWQAQAQPQSQYQSQPQLQSGSSGEYGTVVSSTPVTAQTNVPMQDCRDEQAYLQQRNSGGGALLGALIGGVVGNSVGAGFGRAAATGLGVVAGAAVGDNVEASNNPPVASTVRRCATVSRMETRLIGYDVVYDYRGQRYSTRLAQDPGERVALDVQVTPAGAMAAAPAQSAQPMVQQQVIDGQQSYPVYPATYYPYPAYPAYYPGYYYGPSARVVIGVGGGYRGHRGWR